MNTQQLLEEYDRLRKEKQRLLDDNRAKQIFIDSVLHSRAWRMTRKLQSASGAAKSLIRGKKEPVCESIFVKKEQRAAEANKDFSGHKTDIKTIVFYPGKIYSKKLSSQITLLKQHQIYGLCFSFAELKKLNEIPAVNFCISLDEKDFTKNLSTELRKYLSDSKYIKISSKPAVFINNVDQDFGVNDTLKKLDVTALFHANIMGDRVVNDNADAFYNFMPNAIDLHSIVEAGGKEGVSYERFVRILEEDSVYKDHLSEKPFFYMVMSEDIMTDESIVEYSPDMFYNWVRLVVEKLSTSKFVKEKILLINAGENFLNTEPEDDYANINALSKAILNYPLSDEAVILNAKSEKNPNPGKVALQAHVYYADLAEELFDYLKNINFNFDLYISTDTTEKKKAIQNALSKVKLNCGNIKIEIVENRGRDIYPFIKQMTPVYSNYDFVGHIHTKKTVEHGFGDEWRKYLFSQLLLHADQVFGLFNDSEVGSVFPATYEKISHALSIGNNQRIVNELLGKMKLAKFSEGDKLMFPAGSMFWARREAIAKLFQIGLSEKDFSNEVGQIDGTTAHAVERLFGIIPDKSGYKIVQYFNEN